MTGGVSVGFEILRCAQNDGVLQFTNGECERSKTAELRAIQGAVKAHTKPRITTTRLKSGKTKQDTSKTRKARLPEGSVLSVHNQEKTA